MVIRAYTAGEVSIGKAAEMMGVSHEEMKEILTEGGAEIHLGPRTVDEVLRYADNARANFLVTPLKRAPAAKLLSLPALPVLRPSAPRNGAPRHC